MHVLNKIFALFVIELFRCKGNLNLLIKNVSFFFFCLLCASRIKLIFKKALLHGDNKISTETRIEIVNSVCNYHSNNQPYDYRIF